tara:strand:- start:27472 stop:28887 length:1416 start_codon:yes stop_codon:yes gene_type:complete
MVWNAALAQSPVPEDAEVERLENGFQLSEGPFWHSDGYLLFSDVSGNKIYKWSEEDGLETFLEPSGETNGITADLYGNILIAQHDARQVGRIESDGSITPLATEFNGDQLHSPNDLTVKSDGAVFFTDPPWGGNPSEIDFHGVYRISPSSGEVQLLVDSLSYPNGIAFSPDESKLYVSETQNSFIHVYDVVDDSTLANGKVFAIANEHGNADQNSSDGIKVDNAGNVWATGSEGVVIFDPEGNVLDIINVPESTTNLNWGGTDSLMLFITNFSGLHRLNLGPLERLEAPQNLEATESENEVSLTWESSPESVKYISVYRSLNEEAFEKVYAGPYSESFTDTDLPAESSYSYKVTVTDVMGFESAFSNEAGNVSTSLEESGSLFEGFELNQNYPNPFNPSTVIGYTLPVSSEVQLQVFDMAGREVAELIDGERKAAGTYQHNFDAGDLSSGMYVYRLKAGEFMQSKTLFLIK